MLLQTLAIARNTFVESVRQPIYFVLLMAGWIFQIFNTLLAGYSLGYTDSAEVSADNKLLLDMGLATVFVVATLLAAFIATAVISREIENKTALTVISKPVGRPMFVLGKYLGVSAAILVAAIVLLVFFQFALRHQVMSTARDKPDGPVILFSLLAIGLSVGIGVWGNFFYGWVFSSTAVATLFPASLIAWFGVLLVNKDWEIQPITADVKPQILLASALLLMAIPVLTGVAVAASTRLGQVMTIAACAAVFMGGLLSNYFFGRHAFTNDPLGLVATAQFERDIDRDFRDPNDVIKLTLRQPPDARLEVGDSLYYGPTPSGLGIAVPEHNRFEGDPSRAEDLVDPESGPAVVIQEVEDAGRILTIVNAGGLGVGRLPQAGDYIFLQPAEMNPIAFGAWAIVPNMQFFWLVDAVTQNHPIPPLYAGIVFLYSLAQVGALLSLAVILFQTREVG